MQIVGIEDLPNEAMWLNITWGQVLHSGVEMDIPENSRKEATQEQPQTLEIEVKAHEAGQICPPRSTVKGNKQNYCHFGLSG